MILSIILMIYITVAVGMFFAMRGSLPFNFVLGDLVRQFLEQNPDIKGEQEEKYAETALMVIISLMWPYFFIVIAYDKFRGK